MFSLLFQKYIELDMKVSLKHNVPVEELKNLFP